MSQREDDFPEAVKRTLAARAGHRCSLCDAPTSGPDATGGQAVNVGVAAHIKAASRKGPRYDARQSAEERKSLENAIWMCQTHGKQVDSDDSRFPYDELIAMKSLAEARANARLGRPDDTNRGGDLHHHGEVAAGNDGGGKTELRAGDGGPGARGGDAVIGPGTYRAGDGGPHGKGGDVIIKAGDGGPARKKD